MAKKDDAKSRSRSERFEAELTMTPGGVADYLEGIARRLREGELAVDAHADAFSVPVATSMDVEVAARRGKRKSRLALTIAFRAESDNRDGYTPDNPGPEAQGDGATIPDEMSF